MTRVPLSIWEKLIWEKNKQKITRIGNRSVGDFIFFIAMFFNLKTRRMENILHGG